MKITSLEIQNFRALAHLQISKLRQGIVLAGPNGCGKSCILDAIRMIKSAYGSYQQDEWQQWFSEFQIATQKGVGQLGPLFNDPTKPIRIIATFVFTKEEREFLRQSAEGILLEREWATLTGANRGPAGIPPAMMGKSFAITPQSEASREHVTSRTNAKLTKIKRDLEVEEQSAQIMIPLKGMVEKAPNDLLELAFSIYDPQRLGIIDFHGPNRNYNREQFGSVNLAIESSEEKSKNNALYNYNNKYSNVKSEMASAYVRHLIAKEADPTLPNDDSLTRTLNELFTTFFPGKTFLGPLPSSDGKLDFPVRLANGRTHDIDNLSSGEKEVLYGYLRLHNSAPRNSIIMIDEPELHLNPKLVKGLAPFYLRHLGANLGNQLWLVTHSDTLIRDAVKNSEYDVFHVHQQVGNSQPNQATAISGEEEVERIVLDLIGDAATFRPGAKIVVFESDDNTNFDKRLTCDLFPELEQQVNAISAGNKLNVKQVLGILDKARKAGTLKNEFYAINDSDNDPPSADPHFLQWDVYHIENYLLSAPHILEVVLDHGRSLTSEAEVENELKKCAEEIIPDLLKTSLMKHVNRIMIRCIDVGFDSKEKDKVGAIHQAITKSEAKLKNEIGTQLTVAELSEYSRVVQQTLRTELDNGSWRKRFPGREILSRFSNAHVRMNLTYLGFRDAIIAAMKRKKYQPEGMKDVVDRIINPIGK